MSVSYRCLTRPDGERVRSAGVAPFYRSSVDRIVVLRGVRDDNFLVRPYLLMFDSLCCALVYGFGPLIWQATPSLAVLRHIGGGTVRSWAVPFFAIFAWIAFAMLAERAGRDPYLRTYRLACVFGAVVYTAWTAGIIGGMAQNNYIGVASLAHLIVLIVLFVTGAVTKHRGRIRFTVPDSD